MILEEIKKLKYDSIEIVDEQIFEVVVKEIARE